MSRVTHDRHTFEREGDGLTRSVNSKNSVASCAIGSIELLRAPLATKYSESLTVHTPSLKDRPIDQIDGDDIAIFRSLPICLFDFSNVRFIHPIPAHHLRGATGLSVFGLLGAGLTFGIHHDTGEDASRLTAGH